MQLVTKRKISGMGIFLVTVLFVLMSASTAVYAAITGVSADPDRCGSGGGASIITVEGSSLSSGIFVMASDRLGVEQPVSGVTIDDLSDPTTKQHVELQFPANTSASADVVYDIEVSLDGNNWTQTSATVTVSKVIPTPPADGGIDYLSRDPVAVESLKNSDFKIDLVDEKLVYPSGTYKIKHYSVDGGAKWLANVSIFSDTVKFANLFNKDLNLQLCVDNLTTSEVEYIEFPKINKRPATPKVAVDYLLRKGATAATPGCWVLVSKEKGATSEVISNVLIGKADDSNKNKVDAYGQFKKDTNNEVEGIPVAALLSDGKAAKPVYFVIYAPKEPESAGGAYTPASKPLKLTVPGVQPAPNCKINFKTETVTLTVDYEYSFDGITFTPVKDKKLELPVANYIGNPGVDPLLIRKAATVKSAVSETQIITFGGRGVMEKKDLDVVNGKISAAALKEYEIYNPTTKKWGSMPSIVSYKDHVVELPIRKKADPTKGLAASPDDTHLLRIEYDEYPDAKGKYGIQKASIIDS